MRVCYKIHINFMCENGFGYSMQQCYTYHKTIVNITLNVFNLYTSNNIHRYDNLLTVFQVRSLYRQGDHNTNEIHDTSSFVVE